jgi:TRAP-type C4-dicarboxylate transport system permease large subunit
MIAYVSVGLIGLLALSIPVGIVLFLLGFGIDTFFSNFPLTRGLGNMAWSSSNSATLIAILFFVLLGEILVRGGVATRTYAALDRWVSWLPGGLVHANVATATMFSATSGSSVATAAAVATMAMPRAEKLGYNPKLFSGAIAVGVAGAFIIALAFGGVSWDMLAQSLTGTVKITSMIMLIVIGASFLNFTLASVGLGRELTAFMTGLGLTPLKTILVVVVLYIVLGFFIETLSLMVVTIPIIVPLVVAQGYDVIWFGILMIVLIEMALITPPVGLNLYVVQGARKSGSLNEVMLAMVLLLIAFPNIAWFLPNALQ